MSSTKHREAYSIHEVAQRSGLSIPTLRYYEEMGLVPDVQRDPSSGHRRYSADTIEVMVSLAHLRAVGMSIEDMRLYLALRERGDETAIEKRELFQAHAEELESQIERLRVCQRYLAFKVNYWDARARGDMEEAACVAQAYEHIVEDLKKTTRGRKYMAELLTTPFGATTTAMEVVQGCALQGKRAIVTGGSSGIGVETARALAQVGAEVTLAVRNMDAGEKTATDIKQTTGNQHVYVALLDLSDLNSVHAFVRNWRGPLDILVNNAGIMGVPWQLNAQGHEMHFATNHLGHFALALGLHDALTAAQHARIVSVSSVGHINGELNFNDIDFRTRPYNPWTAYGQSKTANILFAVEAAKRWANDGIVANALNPGRIFSTNILRYVDRTTTVNTAASGPESRGVSEKNIEQGAATSVLLAASPLVENVSGRYFEDCNEAGPHQPGIRRGVAAYAIDPENAARLWEVSLQMLVEAQ